MLNWFFHTQTLGRCFKWKSKDKNQEQAMIIEKTSFKNFDQNIKHKEEKKRKKKPTQKKKWRKRKEDRKNNKKRKTEKKEKKATKKVPKNKFLFGKEVKGNLMLR